MKTAAEVKKQVCVNRQYDTPPESLVREYRGRAEEILDAVGVITDDKARNAIVHFMAGFAISLIDTNDPRLPVALRHDISKKRFERPKGLFFFGPVGTGKTTIARAIAGTFDRDIWTTHDMTSRFCGKDGGQWWADWLAKYEKRTVVIDDIGAERSVKHFGSEFPSRDLFYARSVAWEWYSVPTIYTTNFNTPEDFANTYDDRVADRIIGNCTGVYVGGKSHRRK